MSIFLEQIRKIHLSDKPRRMRLPGVLTTVDVDVNWPPGHGRTAVQFKVEARVGAFLTVDEFETGEVQLAAAARNLQRAIAHEVYGDVRRSILELWPDVLDLRNDPKTWEVSQRIEAKLNEILAGIEP